MKVGVIGVGAVGSASAFAMVERGAKQPRRETRESLNRHRDGVLGGDGVARAA